MFIHMFIDMFLKTRHLHYYMKKWGIYKADCSSLKLLTTKKPFNNRSPNFQNASAQAI